MAFIEYILIGALAALAYYVVYPRIKRRFTVISRLGSVQLTNELNSIRISTVIIKKKGNNSLFEKGLFVMGASRGGVQEVSEHEEIFPLSEREIDEMITLLKSQQVFSVSWKKRSTILLSIDGPSQVARLIFKTFTWMDYSFIARLDINDVTSLLSIFESLKNEASVDHISA
jgi:hypothetical protein